MDEGKAEASKPRPLKVLIAVPTNGMVQAGFSWSLARAMAFFATAPYDGEKQVELTMVKGSNLAQNRTILVSRAFQIGATHILWVDSDMKFPEDAIPALLNRNRLVVAVNYPTKEIEARPTAYAENDDYVGPVWSGDLAEGVADVKRCGMGLMLCDTRIFDAIELPYFQFVPQPPDFITTDGEDYFFCDKLGAAGIKIAIDHDLSKRCAHIGDFEYTNSMSKQAEVTKQELYRGLDK